MKKTLQDIEQIITDGQIPEHEKFRIHLFQQLSEHTAPTLQRDSMIKKLFSFWTLTPFAIGITVLALFVVLTEKENETTQYTFIHSAFAASLESAFGWSTYDTLHYKRIVSYNERYPMQSVIRDIWQYKNSYRLDAYTLPQYSSQMNSGTELKDCIGVKSYDPLNLEKGVYTHRKPTCESNSANNGFLHPTEHTTTATATSEDPIDNNATGFRMTFVTQEPLTETDQLFSQMVDPIVQTSFDGPVAEPLSMTNNILNTKTDSGYEQVFHFGFGLEGIPNANTVWYIQLAHGNQASDVFELNLETLETKIISDNESLYSVTHNEHYSDYVKELFETTATQITPLDIREVQYHGVAAVEVHFAKADSGIIIFTQLIENNRIVQAQFLDSAGDVQSRITIEEDHTITDQNPTEFFSEAFWKEQMKNDVMIERLDAGAAGMVKKWILEMPEGTPVPIIE